MGRPSTQCEASAILRVHARPGWLIVSGARGAPRAAAGARGPRCGRAGGALAAHASGSERAYLAARERYFLPRIASKRSARVRLHAARSANQCAAALQQTGSVVCRDPPLEERRRFSASSARACRRGRGPVPPVGFLDWWGAGNGGSRGERGRRGGAGRRLQRCARERFTARIAARVAASAALLVLQQRGNRAAWRGSATCSRRARWWQAAKSCSSGEGTRAPQ
jgi:hypothetical protein